LLRRDESAVGTPSALLIVAKRRPQCRRSSRLVDRFRVVVFPVITGSSGRERIYDGYPDIALHMISSRTFDGRIQLLEYVITIPAGPPGANDVNA
jgi:hypothetical protein